MAVTIPKGFAQLSNKHALLNKANSTVVISVAITTSIVIFCLFASKSLYGMISYQNKVIDLRSKANAQLEQNLSATNELIIAYSGFSSTPESVLGTAENNSKIILDALPSKYDFPALATSIDGIASGAGLNANSIVGTDQETSAEQSSITPTVVPIPFELEAEGNYVASQQLITDLYRSIRPFKVNTLTFDIGEDGMINVSVIGETYYQPSKELGIEHKKVGTDGKFISDNTKTEAEAKDVN